MYSDNRDLEVPQCDDQCDEQILVVASRLLQGLKRPQGKHKMKLDQQVHYFVLLVSTFFQGSL